MYGKERKSFMSRLTKIPVKMPKGVEVKKNALSVTIKGPKGQVELTIDQGVEFKEEGGMLHFSAGELLKEAPLLGLHKRRIENAIIGVTEGFEKKLELVGVGYKAALNGKDLGLSLGYSHPCSVPIPDGVTVTVEKNTQVKITGADKQVIGQFAATVRSLRPPEPYKGKGVRYHNEVVRRKAGKKTK